VNLSELDLGPKKIQLPRKQNSYPELSTVDRSGLGETLSREEGFFPYAQWRGGRRRTGIWLRGVCASVTVVELEPLGGTVDLVAR